VSYEYTSVELSNIDKIFNIILIYLTFINLPRPESFMVNEYPICNVYYNSSKLIILSLTYLSKIIKYLSNIISIESEHSNILCHLLDVAITLKHFTLLLAMLSTDDLS